MLQLRWDADLTVKIATTKTVAPLAEIMNQKQVKPTVIIEQRYPMEELQEEYKLDFLGQTFRNSMGRIQQVGFIRQKNFFVIRILQIMKRCCLLLSIYKMMLFNGTSGLRKNKLMFHGKILRRHCVFDLDPLIMRILMRPQRIYVKRDRLENIKPNLSNQHQGWKNGQSMPQQKAVQED